MGVVQDVREIELWLLEGVVVREVNDDRNGAPGPRAGHVLAHVTVLFQLAFELLDLLIKREKCGRCVPCMRRRLSC